nr:hypothetical protein [Roseibium sp. MMSF_3247]
MSQTDCEKTIDKSELVCAVPEADFYRIWIFFVVWLPHQLQLLKCNWTDWITTTFVRTIVIIKLQPGDSADAPPFVGIMTEFNQGLFNRSD